MSKKYKEHYDATKLLNTLDANGEKPCFYIVCSHERGPGKTFQFSKLLIERFLEDGSKFILLTRKMGDLGNIAPGILDGYLQYAHKDLSVSEKIAPSKIFSRVALTRGTGEDAEHSDCGYVISLRACDDIKKISSMFYDTWCFYFDEFQPLDNQTYLKNEIDCLYHIYKSIARGDGSAIRYMPVFMASNTITLGNPYFNAFGLNKFIQSNTRFFRGDGVVFENCEVEGLGEQHKKSALDRALKNHLDKKGNNVWINDSDALVCKPDDWGRGTYLCTLKYMGDDIGVLYYGNGITYLSRKVDKMNPNVYALTLENNTLNIPLLRTRNYLDILRTNFFNGTVRVQDSALQSMLMDIFG